MTPTELQTLLCTEGIQLTLTECYSFSQGLLPEIAVRLPGKGPKTKAAALIVGKKGEATVAPTLRMFADVIDGTLRVAPDGDALEPVGEG